MGAVDQEQSRVTADAAVARRPQVGTFANDPSLSAAEIAAIVRWVDTGAPQGDPRDMPTLPRSTDGWQLGGPDRIVELPEVQVPATGRDYFPTATLTLVEFRAARRVCRRTGHQHRVGVSAHAPARKGHEDVPIRRSWSTCHS